MDVARHFKKITSPPPEKDRPTAKDAVAALLPKNTAESEAVLAKQQDLADLEKAIQQTTYPVAKENLQASADALRKEIEALPKVGGNDTETKHRRDIAALKKIHANCELELSERKTKVRGHATVTTTNKQDFLAEIKEARAKLDQLEAQYEALAGESNGKWEMFNNGLTNYKTEIFGLVTTRLTELESASAKPKHNLTAPAAAAAAAAAGDKPSTLQVVEAAGAGDEQAAYLLAQMDYRVDINMTDLREIDLDQPQAAEIEALAQLWAVSAAIGLEDHMAVITFADTGVDISVFAALLGNVAWSKIFYEGGPRPDNAIPFQVRQLVGLQLRGLQQAMQGDVHMAAKERGEKAMKASATRIRAETAKLKKAIKGTGSTVRKA